MWGRRAGEEEPPSAAPAWRFSRPPQAVEDAPPLPIARPCPSAAGPFRRAARLSARFALRCAVVGALLAPVSGRARVYEPETFTLDNGLQVVVVPNHRAPVVSHMVWYKVGSADEQPGKSGLAHYLEHLMFKGTPGVPAGDFSRIVARNGGVENAFTSRDQTAYYQNIARDHLPLVMRLEADRMANLAIDDAQARPELDVVREERRQRTDDNPGARLREQVQKALFGDYPYAHPTVGWMEEVSGLTPQDARTFYRTWYAPNNAILVVTGDITAAELKPLAQATYGALKPHPVPDRLALRPQFTPPSSPQRIVLKDALVQQPGWSRTWIAPSHVWGDTRQVAALEVLSSILNGGAGRLYQALVVARKVAVAAGMGYQAYALGPATLSVSASPLPGADTQEVEQAMDQEVERLLRDGVGAAEVAAAKKRMIAAAVFARDSLQGPATDLGTALSTGGDVAEVEDWPERIAAVGVDEVNAAARAVLGGQGAVTAVLLPDPDAVPALRSGPPSPHEEERIR